MAGGTRLAAPARRTGAGRRRAGRLHGFNPEDYPMTRSTTTTILAATLAAMTMITEPTRASVDGEARGGYYIDAEQSFLGGGILTNVTDRWDFNPNLEWVFLDGGTLMTLNADFHRDMTSGSGPALWLGGGPALIFSDPDVPNADSDTDFGVNLIGGIGARYGSIRPFGQFKYLVSDDNEASVAFGLRF
jgi:hypothetical protein